MEQSKLDNRMGSFHYQAWVIWSILEAVSDAMQPDYVSAQAYAGAIRGATDFAKNLNRDIGDLLEEIRTE